MSRDARGPISQLVTRAHVPIRLKSDIPPELSALYRWRWNGSETALREAKASLDGTDQRNGPMLRRPGPRTLIPPLQRNFRRPGDDVNVSMERFPQRPNGVRRASSGRASARAGSNPALSAETARVRRRSYAVDFHG